MTTNAELYFLEGCGRCPLGGTPDCKVHAWQQLLAALRRIVLECGLDEACKWGMPCYTVQGKNVLMISAFKDNCTISFFKGALLHDEHGMLAAAGENSHIARLLRFTQLNEILSQEEHIKTYIYQAIEVEKAGLKPPKGDAPDIPEELQRKFEAAPAFRQAFEALTPGRQRGYLLYFTAAKQSATRAARIEKYMPLIFAGKGMHD
jgi:uncharacterized protein YdeI (YjbR/CyaY-like superfamily)